ncbi:MAG: tRNA(Met) cytidine acetyltransferase [Flavobacteriales bacterium]
MQKHDIDSICQQFGLTGKKMLNQQMKDYISFRINITNINPVNN